MNTDRSKTSRLQEQNAQADRSETGRQEQNRKEDRNETGRQQINREAISKNFEQASNRSKTDKHRERRW